jgi:nucleoside phosphorylase
MFFLGCRDQQPGTFAGCLGETNPTFDQQNDIILIMTVLVLTPLAVEYAAVVRQLTGNREVIFHDQAAYEQVLFQGKHHTYTMVLREPGMRNTEMALATEKAIQRFQPQIVLLVGIAGGVKDVQIGDVLIGRKAYGYESGKEDADGFKARPAVESFSGDLLARAQALSRTDDWKKRTNDGAVSAKVFMGPIAAGEKVVADINNPTFQRIKTHYNDTLGLEMEAIGFATAVQPHRNLHALVIRGISDMCEGKAETDQHNWQPIAAERAAAFAFELLWMLDAAPFIQHATKRASQTGPITPAPNMKFQQDMRQRISKGDIGNALKMMLAHTEQSNMEAHSQLVLLSDRLEGLGRRTRLGTISNADAGVERGQIVMGVLELVNIL